MSTNKIGWQKYEDYLEKQLSCPLLQNIIQSMVLNHLEDSLEDEDDEDEDDEDYLPKASNVHKGFDASKVLPLTPDVIEDITMLANFECWIGHTNFDITHRVKDRLNKVPGIEILKVISRYRFFVGVGQMFDFQEVRHDIEKELIQGDIDDE